MSTNNPMTPKQLDAIRERVDVMTVNDSRCSYPWPDPTNERIKELEKENTELRKRLTVDDAMVERAAGTLFKQDFLERNPWADDARAQHSLEQVRVSTPKAWGQHLQVARAALDAALSAEEGS